MQHALRKRRWKQKPQSAKKNWLDKMHKSGKKGSKKGGKKKKTAIKVCDNTTYI
jgi:hypothetical protein